MRVIRLAPQRTGFPARLASERGIRRPVIHRVKAKHPGRDIGQAT